MSEKNEAHKVREEVSRNYTQAIKSSSGCCGGGSSCCGSSAGQGYTDEEILDLLSDPELISFGCGNPMAYSGVKEGDTVLDLGSGAGLDLLLAAKRTGPSGKVIGVDMTDEMIATANRIIERSGVKNVEVRKGFIEDIPVESGTVDWVISNCVINLSPEKEKVFDEIYRVLKRGGKMLISDVVARELPDWIKNSEELYSSCIAGAISEEDYVTGLENAGLKEIEIRERVEYGVENVRDYVLNSPDFPAKSREEREKIVEQYQESIAGKIHSIQIYAEKE
jgi:ubiquinone/menaquinone biosynthesis C-methylase UbiE